MYYQCSENKDADQLRGYREADLRLCFRTCRLLVFPRGGTFIEHRLYIHPPSTVNVMLGYSVVFGTMFLICKPSCGMLPVLSAHFIQH